MINAAAVAAIVVAATVAIVIHWKEIKCARFFFSIIPLHFMLLSVWNEKFYTIFYANRFIKIINKTKMSLAMSVSL